MAHTNRQLLKLRFSQETRPSILLDGLPHYILCQSQVPKLTLTRAFIKTAGPDDPRGMETLMREYDCYHLPSIASATSFRKMYDMTSINSGYDDSETIPYLALEWCEDTLADLKYRPGVHNYTIIKAVVEAGLESCVVLNDSQLVNTGIMTARLMADVHKSAQISNLPTFSSLALSLEISPLKWETWALVSRRALNRDIPTSNADMRVVFRDGTRFSAKPYVMRAPEVWQMQPCIHVSQVCALAAMLLCWMRPRILSNSRCPMPFIDDGWCIAKLMRFFPGWTVPSVENEVREKMFELARAFMDDPQAGLERISVLDDEMEKADMLTEVKDLLRLMLVADSSKRPSAAQVLASEGFLALEKAAAGIK